MPTVYLALGSNLGDRHANLLRAIEELRPVAFIEGYSSIYETAPAYVTDQPYFLNAALRAQTILAPLALLRYIKQIERGMGRKPSIRFGPRLIDIDILHYDGQILNEAKLILPHPRITERAFVLLPLAEIAPELVLPGQSENLAALAARAIGSADVLKTDYPFDQP